MKAFIILALAVACVMAAEETEKVKTEEKVFVGYPFGVHGFAVAKTGDVPAVTAYTAAYPFHYGVHPYGYGVHPYAYGVHPYHYGVHHVVV